MEPNARRALLRHILSIHGANDPDPYNPPQPIFEGRVGNTLSPEQAMRITNNRLPPRPAEGALSARGAALDAIPPEIMGRRGRLEGEMEPVSTVTPILDPRRRKIGFRARMTF